MPRHSGRGTVVPCSVVVQPLEAVSCIPTFVPEAARLQESRSTTRVRVAQDGGQQVTARALSRAFGRHANTIDVHELDVLIVGVKK